MILTKPIRFSIDLEDTLEDNKSPFLDFFNKFLENNHSDRYKKEGEVAAEDLEGWGFANLQTILEKARNWDEMEEDAADLFFHGEHYMVEEDLHSELKEKYGGIWPGFHRLSGNILRGRPEEYPIKDNGVPEYLEVLQQAFPDGNVDLVTSRADNGDIKERPDDYSATDGLREGIEEYAEIHDFSAHIDNLVITADKTTHENDYDVFFDDKPSLPEELEESQYQVMLETVSNEDKKHLYYEDIKDGSEGLEDSNVVKARNVEEGFEALIYIGSYLKNKESSGRVVEYLV